MGKKVYRTIKNVKGILTVPLVAQEFSNGLIKEEKVSATI
jgi:hypothetical protein